ncbi:MAG: RagB/SusD family nutrient uptake outer membrane protein [Agriterribacter sp.]
MKNIIVLFYCILIITSCKKDILDVAPKDRLAEESVWKDAKLIELYVTTNYHAVEHGFYQNIFGCGISDETTPNGNQNYVLQGTLNSDNVTQIDPGDSYNKIGSPQGLNYWKTAYSYIRNVNIFFSHIDASPIDDALKNRLKGEMKFIRAWIYSNLIWRYGGVPVIKDVFELNKDFTDISRSPYDECVDFISEDLDDAISLLPARETGANLGRASGDAAKALKSRVLLYAASPLNNPSNDKAKWQKAADAAEALLNSGYSLNSNYQNLFLAKYLSSDNEIIFARYFTQANFHRLNINCGRNGDHGWGAQNSPTQNLVDDYEMTNGELPFLTSGEVNPASGYNPQDPYVNRDPRFEATIIHDGSIWMGRATESYSGGLDSPEGSIEAWNASTTSYYIKKFVDPDLPPSGSSINATSSYIFFRYAEILLNYAEAKFELGDETNARKYLNMVRDRTGVNMPAVTTAGQELREKIHHEYRIELAFEGRRYFDVRRWKIAPETESKSVMGMRIDYQDNGSKVYTPFVIMERHFYDQLYLVPIPRAEIDKSLGALTQNPGY